jgi:hypothetical protein
LSIHDLFLGSFCREPYRSPDLIVVSIFFHQPPELSERHGLWQTSPQVRLTVTDAAEMSYLFKRLTLIVAVPFVNSLPFAIPGLSKHRRCGQRFFVSAQPLDRQPGKGVFKQKKWH